nr:cache domain-containing protein [Jannaschia sp. LMIT008]
MLIGTAASAATLFGVMPAMAVNERGTRDEAVAMVDRALAQCRADGLDALIASVNAQDPRYVDRDLYVFVNTQKGISVGHAANPAVVGNSLWEAKDPDGLLLVQKIVADVASGSPVWVDYKWPDPITGRVRQKSSYCVLIDRDHHLGVGIYTD